MTASMYVEYIAFLFDIFPATSSPCEPNPCQNGGLCQNFGANVFNCLCTPGWSGPICTDSTALTGK